MKLEAYEYEGVYQNTLEEVIAAYLNGYGMINTVKSEGKKIYVPKDYQMYILDDMMIAGVIALDEEVGEYNVYGIKYYGEVLLKHMFNTGTVHEYDMIEKMKKKADGIYIVKLRMLLGNGFIEKSLGELCTFEHVIKPNGYGLVATNIHRYNFKIGGGLNIDKYHLECVFSKLGVSITYYSVNMEGDSIGTFELSRSKEYKDYKFMVDTLASYDIG